MLGSHVFYKLILYHALCFFGNLQGPAGRLHLQPKRGRKDAFSVFHPRCSAKIPWQMAEDRFTGTQSKNSVLLLFTFLFCSMIFCEPPETGVGWTWLVSIWSFVSWFICPNIFPKQGSLYVHAHCYKVNHATMFCLTIIARYDTSVCFDPI